MKQLLLGIVIPLSIVVTSACQGTGLNSYSNHLYSLEYPQTYTLVEATESEPILTVQNEQGRIEIFDLDDFGGERIHGFSSSGLEEFEAKLVPKEKIEKDGYHFWMFYTAGDQDTLLELQSIFNSFVVQ